MALLIDLGNTNLKWRVLKAGELVPGDQLAHGGEALNVNSLSALPLQGERFAYIASVARPELREALATLLDQAGLAQDWLMSPARGLGITNSYATPHKLGIDRYLALAAAFASHAEACCVIDVGTATTVDICNAQGQHQGGLIAPGPAALARALTHTALPLADEQLPDELGLACDTETALQLGALHSACGLVERAFALAHKHYGCRHVLLTGGGAPILAPHLNIPLHIDLVSDAAFRSGGTDIHFLERRLSHA